MIRLAKKALTIVLERLVPVKRGYSLVHVKDIPETWNWLMRLRYNRDEIILEAGFQGLGDNLFYSHLPELLVKSDLYKKVYLSAHSPMRYPEMMDLIWKDNPYLSGIIPRHGWTHCGLRPEAGNFMDGMVNQFTGRVPQPGETTPRLYNAKRFRTADTGTYEIIDLNRISNRHRLNKRDIVEFFSRRWEGKNPPMLLAYEAPLFQEILSSFPLLQGLERQGRLRLLPREPSLTDFFKRICNAAHYYGLYSGGVLVAAAYGVPTTTFCEFRDPAISIRGHAYITNSDIEPPEYVQRLIDTLNQTKP